QIGAAGHGRAAQAHVDDAAGRTVADDAVETGDNVGERQPGCLPAAHLDVEDRGLLGHPVARSAGDPGDKRPVSLAPVVAGVVPLAAEQRRPSAEVVVGGAYPGVHDVDARALAGRRVDVLAVHGTVDPVQ